MTTIKLNFFPIELLPSSNFKDFTKSITFAHVLWNIWSTKTRLLQLQFNLDSTSPAAASLLPSMHLPGPMTALMIPVILYYITSHPHHQTHCRCTGISAPFPHWVSFPWPITMTMGASSMDTVTRQPAASAAGAVSCQSCSGAAESLSQSPSSSCM